MTLAGLSWNSPAEPTQGRGWCELVAASNTTARAAELEAAGYLIVRVDDARLGGTEGGSHAMAGKPAGPGSHDGAVGTGGLVRTTLLRRGRLGEALRGAIDLALAQRGASPREDEDAAPDERAQAQEQLLHARDLGAAGLCLVLPELAPLADERGRLEADDSEALVRWTELALVWPVVVLVQRADADLRVWTPRTVAEVVTAAGLAAPRSRLGGAPSRPARAATPPARTPAPARRSSPPVKSDTSPPSAIAPEAERPCWLDPRMLREHAAALARSRGPQPARLVEQLFRTRYLPLLGALSAGQRHDEAQAALDGWRQDFERTYTDGYTALRVTGRRPAMVLDVPEIATRLARLNGARTTELVLVDAMRFDLGERVATRLRRTVGDRAVCVDQLLLWAALPTITPTQLRLLETGARGLRDGEPVSEREPTILRGGSLSTLRRLRIGQRNLLKLDVAEARLREVGPEFAERMTAIAEEIGDALARFVRSLAPRSLLVVFGDHGFRLSPADASSPAGSRATLPAQQGGASPEEVLVPASAWLIGEVH